MFWSRKIEALSHHLEIVMASREDRILATFPLEFLDLTLTPDPDKHQHVQEHEFNKSLSENVSNSFIFFTK